MISTLALLAKKAIEAAWLNGPAYDLATLAAEALEAEGLLQAPGAGEALARADAEYERLRVALESAKRGRRELRSRVAELERKLEQERKACDTNFWWYVGQKDRADAARDDAVKALTEAAELAPEHAEALCDRARAIAKAPTWPDERPTHTVYRAQHDSIVMGYYATTRAAREHCVAALRYDMPTAAIDWIEDDEDGIAELVAAISGEERPTGYFVAALEVGAAYDPEADE
ncbi:hypothetical protein ACGGAI_23735 [Streptomyces antibioticus]|uniref:hypothetical protein n=1 Tax=Streptomyces antibioticus TaxID=1890 RepID=UPI003724381F